jgi:superfamily II DNA helicase RecQ
MIPATMPDAAQEAVNRFCGAHRVVSVEKQFVQDGERSYWALCVNYLDASKASEDISLSPLRKGKIDYRTVLNEHDFALYARLRSLRKTLSEQEGIPAYALFTNEQLAAMIQKRVTSKAALGTIPGVGAGRLDKYGDAFLQLLQQSNTDTATAEADAS